jgi:hypothetical protein
MTIESCVVAMIIGGLLIAFNEPLARLLHMFYKLIGLDSTRYRLQRTKLILIINGTIVMIIYGINLRNLLTSAPLDR